VAKTRRDAWVRLERVLEDNRIDQEDFALQAVRHIKDGWRSPAAADPISAFVADEATILQQGGLDLAPMRPSEPDIVLQTATSLALIEAKAAPAAEVAAALAVSRARVRQRAVERTLYAVRVDDEWRFPRWQFDEAGRPLPGVASVIPAIPRGVHPVAVSRFMSEPSPDLEVLDERVSPLEWLRSGGDPEPVVAIAREL
jgi:hypothetical protein